jgi:hypothetical protein
MKQFRSLRMIWDQSHCQLRQVLWKSRVRRHPPRHIWSHHLAVKLAQAVAMQAAPELPPGARAESTEPEGRALRAAQEASLATPTESPHPEEDPAVEVRLGKHLQSQVEMCHQSRVPSI